VEIEPAEGEPDNDFVAPVPYAVVGGPPGEAVLLEDNGAVLGPREFCFCEGGCCDQQRQTCCTPNTHWITPLFCSICQTSILGRLDVSAQLRFALAMRARCSALC